MMGDFRKLEVWQKTQKLVSSVYRLTSAFPAAERYGLSSSCDVLFESVWAHSQLECEILLSNDLQFLEAQMAVGIVAEIHSIRGMLQNLHRALLSKPTRHARSALDPRP
jgi:hypothetical protein